MYVNVPTLSNLGKMFIFLGILKASKEKSRNRSRNLVRIEMLLTRNTVC
jgi:hypothetical protein